MNLARAPHNLQSDNLNNLKDLNKRPFIKKNVKKSTVKSNNAAPTDFHCYSGLVLSSDPQIRKFHGVIWQTTSKNSTKGRAARAARFFFLIQPIKSLIYNVVVAVAVVVS